MTNPLLRTLAVLGLIGGTLSGCALVAGGVAGGVTATEIEENDGEFDPLENTEAAEAVDDAF